MKSSVFDLPGEKKNISPSENRNGGSDSESERVRREKHYRKIEGSNELTRFTQKVSASTRGFLQEAHKMERAEGVVVESAS